MKIVLEQQGRHLEMYVAHDPNNQFNLDWDAAIADMAAELDHRQGVKRMSYDVWYWDLRKKHEAEEYITYFYLKHQ